ncbi:hypothetical protein DL766_001189 [Monosporascus sp. MC13-8B]|uniref:Uncharacterized protein n=1 Tax=Monosporascus cannonballus TaxID=155416 RepID=A0ABY0HD57_9PEZI|nr:hypothetical protein DL762_002678 [Monosporascus cannonballus]RYO97690.1 hypothetical protein DL763_002667 [Monosporascus cannonballus]RYP38110.1 hypothetical protein DL766_001189 [Monosporascus sp. MC13-8B]
MAWSLSSLALKPPSFTAPPPERSLALMAPHVLKALGVPDGLGDAAGAEQQAHDAYERRVRVVGDGADAVSRVADSLTRKMMRPSVAAPTATAPASPGTARRRGWQP